MVGAVIITALAQQWTASIAPWTIAVAPAIGALVGLSAGVYPAIQAGRIEPATALWR